MKKSEIKLRKETNGTIHKKIYDSKLYIIRIVDFEGRSAELIPKNPLMPTVKTLNEHLDITFPDGHDNSLISLYIEHLQEVEELLEFLNEL